MKVPKKQAWDGEELRSFREEVAITRSAFHTNVVLFLGACTVPGSIMIVIERMSCDLATLLHRRDRVPPALLREPLTLLRKTRMAHDAALGITWLHEILKIVHRDLKPANLLLDDNLRVKVTDFGFSELRRDASEPREVQMKGTALYAAPEIWKKEGCSTASDVYSFGIILWELFTEEEPFLGYLEATDFFEDVVVKGVRPTIPTHATRLMPSRCESPGPVQLHQSASYVATTASASPTIIPQALRQLITACWDADPKARPTMLQVRMLLEEGMLECQLESPAAREFWKKYFRDRGPEGSLSETVPWENFTITMARASGVPLIQIRQLAGMFAPEDEVTMARFDILQKWFGDFFADPQIVEEMRDISFAPWFAGDISKEIADRWLTGREDLTFLVRFSATDAVNFPFTISKRKDGKNVHRRIQRLSYDTAAEERYSVDISEDPGYVAAPTLGQLIEKLRAIRNVGVECPKEELASSNPYEPQRFVPSRRLHH